ncbi:hypothetical protein AOLI_G00285310 [Acnodon oligacanthus]
MPELLTPSCLISGQPALANTEGQVSAPTPLNVRTGHGDGHEKQLIQTRSTEEDGIKTPGFCRHRWKEIYPSRMSSPTNKDMASLPAKWLGEGTGNAYASAERYRENDQGQSKISSGAVRRRPQVRYKTHTQLIKEKLEQIKAEMQKLSEQHLRLRPARKAYHPFVWNSLSPYRDTTEIDYLLARSSDHHTRDGGTLVRQERVHLFH